jgi:hypothetical protein
MAVDPNTVGNPLDLSQPIAATTNQAYSDWLQEQQQMAWAKSQFAGNATTAAGVQAGDEATQQQMQDASTQDRALYTGSYVPAMQQQLDYAENYTTPDRMAANRGAAMATANIAGAAQNNAAKMQLQSVGVNPSSGQFAGLNAGLAAAAAGRAAAAGTTSDRTTEQLGQQYLEQAIQTGAVLPGQAVNESGLAVGAGNAAVNTGLATTASGSATMGTPLQWNAQGNQMLANWPAWASTATNAGLTQNRDTATESEAQQKINQSSSSGVGALIGAGAGILGSVVGGPVGGAIGSMAGKALGSLASSGGSGATADSIMGLGSAKGGLIKFATGGLASTDDIDASDVANLYADGGAPPDSNMVHPDQSPSRGAKTDDVHAMLNEGEFVVPKDVTSWLGEKFLQNLINKSRMEAAGPKAEPEQAPMPQAMALSPPSFHSEGARAGAPA